MMMMIGMMIAKVAILRNSYFSEKSNKNNF